MNNAKIKKTIFVLLVASAGLIFCGCADDDYAKEKKYWKIKKQAERILTNPHATPPNELERTVAALDKFSQEHPKSNLGLDAEYSIAHLYILKEEYELGRQQLKKLAQKYEKSPELAAQAIFLIGNSYEMQDKWPSALEQYKKIMRDYPETMKGLQMPVYIAQHYKVKYEPDKMLTAYQEAIDYYKAIAAKHPVTPLSFNMDMLIAQCYGEMKDWSGAINTLNSILVTYNGKVRFEEVLLSLASIHSEKLNNPAKAIEVLEVLIKEYPKSRYVKPAKDIIKRLSAKQ
jgi:TolA-binding protein